VPTDRELLTQVVRDALFTLLHQPDAPTAIFCMKDIFLGATLDACDQLELLVPQDLEVMSFTDWPLMTARLPRQVHRLVQRSQEIGRLAAGRLLERLHGETRPSEVQRLPADFYPAQAAVGKLSGERESTVHLAKRGTECNG
jgi:DNA-binding LacI/PurR family transcriptional regulator